MYLYHYVVVSYPILIPISNNTISRNYPVNNDHYMYLYSDEALPHLIPSRNLNNSITWYAPTNDDR